MQVYVQLDEQGNVRATSTADNLKDSFLADAPDDFEPERQYEYRLIKGSLVHDPLPEQEVALTAQDIPPLG